MTKKLEDLLNLPDSKDIIKNAESQEKEQESYALKEQEKTFRDIAEFDKIASALPAVKGLGEMADKELNEVADKAMSENTELFEIGYVDTKSDQSLIFV